MRILRWLGIWGLIFCLSLALAACSGGDSTGSNGDGDTVPSAPTIGAVTAGDGTLSLSWAAVDGASSYKVWYNTADDSSAAVQQGGDITAISYTITGLANGTPYYVWVKAKNSAGDSDFSKSSNGTPVAPDTLSITTQPASQSVLVGQAATFSVVASGTGTLSYQWYKDATSISGATSASYTTSATTTADNSAKFSVVVSNSTDSVTSSEATLTVRESGSVAGVLPTGMPSHMAVGLFEDTGETWMKDSGVAWDARYRYFTKGWVNNWGWGNYDGSWGLAYMEECDDQGFLPVIQYYQMNGESGYDESAFYATTKNATTMKSYFGDFKILMQRAKEFGKPVLVLMEGDGYAYMEIQSGDDPTAYSAVADTGMTELQGLPNTAAGWGLAFLQIRKSVGASNVILGMHISAWATGLDISYYSVTEPLDPQVQTAYTFLSKLGLADNVTGETYDVLVGDPLDRDSDYYSVVKGEDRWWGASDSASISSKSFNRYAEWLRIWNETAQKRWVLWQIPLGNSNHLNVFNNGNSREGYKDNRAEYFFANGDTTHLQKFADVGVIALLFGAGASGQSTYTNDVYTDGQLFMKSRAGAILAGGSVALEP
jgi:hypothetical protein